MVKRQSRHENKAAIKVPTACVTVDAEQYSSWREYSYCKSRINFAKDRLMLDCKSYSAPHCRMLQGAQSLSTPTS
jgi:hypothetical protein